MSNTASKAVRLAALTSGIVYASFAAQGSAIGWRLGSRPNAERAHDNVRGGCPLRFLPYAKIEWRLKVPGRRLFFDIGCCLGCRRCRCSEMLQSIADCLNRLLQP